MAGGRWWAGACSSSSFRGLHSGDGVLTLSLWILSFSWSRSRLVDNDNTTTVLSPRSRHQAASDLTLLLLNSLSLWSLLTRTRNGIVIFFFNPLFVFVRCLSRTGLNCYLSIRTYLTGRDNPFLSNYPLLKHSHQPTVHDVVATSSPPPRTLEEDEERKKSERRATCSSQPADRSQQQHRRRQRATTKAHSLEPSS